MGEIIILVAIIAAAIIYLVQRYVRIFLGKRSCCDFVSPGAGSGTVSPCAACGGVNSFSRNCKCSSKESVNDER